MTRESLARRERRALCDTALAVGEDAPTLCGDWDAKELVAHLLVRERSPLAALGIAVPPLAAAADRAMARQARRDFSVLVERVRRPGPIPGVAPVVEPLLNTLEFFVHHEDLRRAQPGWEPRDLDAADLDALWRGLRLAGRGLVRQAGVPLRARRTDTGDTITLRPGDDPVVVSGPPAEVVLRLHGRRQVRDVEAEGPEGALAQLRQASLGF